MLRLNSTELKVLLFLVLFFSLSLPSNLYSDDSAASSWVENSPGAIKVNFNGLATDNVNCLVGVCDAGKIYYLTMVNAKGDAPGWKKAIVSTQNDFKSVAGGSGNFLAVTADEWFIGPWGDPNRFKWNRMGSLANVDTVGEFVAVVHVSGKVFTAVTSKGKIFRIEEGTINEVTGVPLPEMAAQSGVKGITRLNDMDYFIYGYPGSDEVNMFRVRFQGVDVDSAIDPPANSYTGSDYTIKQGGQSVELNDLAILDDQKWYIAGQNGVLGYGTDDLSNAGDGDFTTTSTVNGAIPNHVTAVGVGSRVGFHEAFACAESGRILYTSLTDGGLRRMEQPFASATTENYNALVFLTVEDINHGYRAFLGGNNGVAVHVQYRGAEALGHFFSYDKSPVFRSIIYSLCSVSGQRFFAGGSNGLFYRGDKSDDGSFNWTKSEFHALGSSEIKLMEKCDDTMFVLWGEDNSYFNVAEFNLEGQFQGASGDCVDAGCNNAVAVESSAKKLLFVGSNKELYLYIEGQPAINKLTVTGVENYDGYWVAGDDVDSLYAVGTKNSGDDSVLFSLTDQRSSWAGAVIKDLPGVLTAGMTTLNGKLYVSGFKAATNKAYLAEYDGNNFVELPPGPDGIAVGNPWGYGDCLYFLSSGQAGYIYSYNLKTKVWTSESVTSINLRALSGSGEGKVLMTGGYDGRAFRTKISASSGEETSTEVLPAAGEDADLIASNNPVKRSSAELTKQFNTETDFEPLSNVEDFVTKATLAAGSVHCFKFNVTPDVNVRVNDCHLYKLISSSSSSTDYTRLNIIPAAGAYAHGTYWLTDPDGVVKVSGEQLQAGTTYTVTFVIEDNGATYDANPALGTIADPTVFGYSGSGGGGGCVLDPGQDEKSDLTWILLGMAIVTLVCRWVILRFKEQR